MSLDKDENESIFVGPTRSAHRSHTPTQLSMPAFDQRYSLRSDSTTQIFDPILQHPPPAGGPSMRTSDLFSNKERADALKADPGSEKDFDVVENKFAFSPGQLNKLVNPKSLDAYIALGGLKGIEYGLRTDIMSGLSLDEAHLKGRVSFEEATAHEKVEANQSLGAAATHDVSQGQRGLSVGSFSDRIRVFGKNSLPEKKPTLLWKLKWMACNDEVLWILAAAVAISQAAEFCRAFGVDYVPDFSPPIDCLELSTISITIIVIVVGSLSNYRKERTLIELNTKERLNTEKENRQVQVIRSGKACMVSIHEILTGDVVVIEPGDISPTDGIFIAGHGVKCDESSVTGESDVCRKYPGHDVYQELKRDNIDRRSLDPFIVSGSKVVQGFGRYLVTSVGVHSGHGKSVMARRNYNDSTPLQSKLNGISAANIKVSSDATTGLFLVVLFHICTSLLMNPLSLSEKATQNPLTLAVIVISLSMPEGLPHALTQIVALATTQMVKLKSWDRIPENRKATDLELGTDSGLDGSDVRVDTGATFGKAAAVDQMMESKSSHIESKHLAAIPAVPQTPTGKGATGIHHSNSQSRLPLNSKRKPQANTAIVYEPEISGFLGGTSVRAFPDSGSVCNIVSHDFAKLKGLKITNSTGGIIHTAAGSPFKSLGTVILPFRFAEESETYMQEFHVLAKSLYDVILGSKFLQATRTFTHFSHRVAKKLRSASLGYRVCFAGSSQQMLAGWTDGKMTCALPDTGSDVCLMSLAYARSRGYSINTAHKHRKTLELIDGSMAETLGQVEAFQWKFNQSDSHAHRPDVYVLDHLQTDLLLSYDFLMSCEAFSAHEESFFDAETHGWDSSEAGIVGTIKLVTKSKLRNFRKKLARTMGLNTDSHINTELNDLDQWSARKTIECDLYAKRRRAALALPEPRRALALDAARAEWTNFYNSWPGGCCATQTPCGNGGCNLQLPSPIIVSNGSISSVATASPPQVPIMVASLNAPTPLSSPNGS